jgi:hypothetical protein
MENTVEGDSLDQKALTIKARSVTFSMDGVGTAFSSHNPSLFLLSAIAFLLFRLIEGCCKLFQQAYYPRFKEVELLMAGQEVAHPTAPWIAQSWSEAWRAYRLTYVLKWPHVYLPHAVVVFGCIVLYVGNAYLHILGQRT